MELRQLKELIKEIQVKDGITFSKHFNLKGTIRRIGMDEILLKLSTPADAIAMEDQGEEPKGHKYALLFKKLTNYDLKIVVSIKDSSLNIVTAYIINKKRRAAYLRWLESQK